jgi:hypothetical protein
MMRHYEPVIGALWGTDIDKLKLNHRLLCRCREFVTIVTTNDGPWAWTMQHGPNPEHRSPWFTTALLDGAQEWLESIHLR